MPSKGKYQVVPRELRARNRRMLKLADAGATMAELGRLHRISRERVRQILVRERRALVAELESRATKGLALKR